MMKVFRRALVAATIAFSAEMALADDLPDGLTAAQALESLRLSAVQGDAFAQTMLGGIYLNGIDVIQDAAEAARWFRLAADQGNAAAQNNLGRISVGCTYTELASSKMALRRCAGSGSPQTRATPVGSSISV